nr:MAG TPA: Minor capsid protein [Caudoviricetes sp.]
MGIKFSVHTDGMDAVKDKLAQGCKKAEHALAVQVMRDTDPFVPMLTGSLMQRTHVEGYTAGDFGPGSGNVIVYPGPYARFLYYGKVMVDPNTGSTYAPKGGTKVLTDKNLVFNHANHPQAQAHWCEASKAQNLDKWLRVADKAVKKYGTG